MENNYSDRRPSTLTTWKLSNTNTELGNTGIQLGNYDAPKTKFLYTVSFTPAAILQNRIGFGSEELDQNHYPCKSVTRPNINVNYVEVNAYNRRFKVATRTDVGTVTVSFYDDNKNTAHKLLRLYLEEISPVAKRTLDNYSLKEFNQAFSSLGPLPEHDADGLLKRMRVTHHYNSGNRLDEANYSRIHYDYINPKIQMFNWDELDMASSESPMISITFVYDSVNISESHNVGNDDPSYNPVTIENLPES